MDRTLSYWPVALALVALVIVAALLPEGRPTQALSAGFTGVAMLLISNLLRRPHVVIEDLGKEVKAQVYGEVERGHGLDKHPAEVVLTLGGVLVNKSATADGDISRLWLRVFVSKDDYVDIPSLEEYEGKRIRSYGRHPNNNLVFRAKVEQGQASRLLTLSGKPAEVHLKVVGQPEVVKKVVVAAPYEGVI